jgi:2-polyprenyl-3-methyl-5-hydroxy-6-metoxy-1,4-benzoquinol methylase
MKTSAIGLMNTLKKRGIDENYNSPMNTSAPASTATGTPLNAHTACPCCGERSAQVIANKDGKTGGALLTVSCNGCGLGRIDPLPSDQELADWYATQYRQAYKSAVQPALRHVLRAGRNAQWRWQWLCQNTDARWSNADLTSQRSLDIGSSSGEFVYLLQTLGFQAKGIEPHAGYATYAQSMLGIQVNNNTLQQGLACEDAGSLDLISMFHVLEHLAEPVAALRTMGEKLKPGGLLYIEVPNATRLCSPDYMFFRAHTLYFTGPTLRKLLETAGFKLMAQSPDDSDNLSVVAQFIGADSAGSSAGTGTDASHSLVTAHRARRWLPYLVQQLQDGQPMRKWRTRQEEKRSAAQYANGLALLDDLYGKKAA